MSPELLAQLPHFVQSPNRLQTAKRWLADFAQMYGVPMDSVTPAMVQQHWQRTEESIKAALFPDPETPFWLSKPTPTT